MCVIQRDGRGEEALKTMPGGFSRGRVRYKFGTHITRCPHCVHGWSGLLSGNKERFEPGP